MVFGCGCLPLAVDVVLGVADHVDFVG